MKRILTLGTACVMLICCLLHCEPAHKESTGAGAPSESGAFDADLPPSTDVLPEVDDDALDDDDDPDAPAVGGSQIGNPPGGRLFKGVVAWGGNVAMASMPIKATVAVTNAVGDVVTGEIGEDGTFEVTVQPEQIYAASVHVGDGATPLLFHRQDTLLSPFIEVGEGDKPIDVGTLYLIKEASLMTTAVTALPGSTLINDCDHDGIPDARDTDAMVCPYLGFWLAGGMKGPGCPKTSLSVQLVPLGQDQLRMRLLVAPKLALLDAFAEEAQVVVLEGSVDPLSGQLSVKASGVSLWDTPAKPSDIICDMHIAEDSAAVDRIRCTVKNGQCELEVLAQAQPDGIYYPSAPRLASPLFDHPFPLIQKEAFLYGQVETACSKDLSTLVPMAIVGRTNLVSDFPVHFVALDPACTPPQACAANGRKLIDGILELTCPDGIATFVRQP